MSTQDTSDATTHTATDASAGDACSCGSDHDHGPTGAEVVQMLGKGFAIATSVVPGLAFAIVAFSAFSTPSSPLPLLLGVALGIGQLLILLGLGSLTARTELLHANGPLFVATRAITEEVLRLIVVLYALVLFPVDLRGPLGLWVGLGAMLVWATVATVQLALSRQRIMRPGEWSRATVNGILAEHVSVPRALVMRFVDILAVFLFQVGATILVAGAPIMAAAMAVLAMASGLSTLVVQRYPAYRRHRTAWVYAPIGVSLLVVSLAVMCVLVPGV